MTCIRLGVMITDEEEEKGNEWEEEENEGTAEKNGDCEKKNVNDNSEQGM